MVLEALVVAGLVAAAAYVGYKYGVRAKAEVVAAHTFVSAKLAAVKAEVMKLEAEAKAEEQAVVARIKVLL